MAQSCRRNLATTMLVDGTFSDDRDFLGEIVRTVVSRGSRLHLFLYLSNGPSQRNPINRNRGIGPSMPPEEFRRRIISDPALQSQYQNRVQWALPLVSYALSLGAQVSLIPMLEDNLDAAAARQMEQLTLAVIPSSMPVSLGRNPCPGCYPGNDKSVPAGIFLDQHIRSLAEGVQVSNGLVTNDGTTLAFPGENKGIPFQDLAGIIKQAGSRNNSYVIWHDSYQGLIDGSRLDQDLRTYAVPSESEAIMLAQLLAAQ